MGLRDLCQSIHEMYAKGDIARLTTEMYLSDLQPAMKPSDAYAHIAHRQTERVDIDELEGRITTALLTPYPPGIPLLIPGERFNKKIVDYLRFTREFNAAFPGFDTDVHGLVERGRRRREALLRRLRRGLTLNRPSALPRHARQLMKPKPRVYPRLVGRHRRDERPRFAWVARARRKAPATRTGRLSERRQASLQDSDRRATSPSRRCRRRAGARSAAPDRRSPATGPVTNTDWSFSIDRRCCAQFGLRPRCSSSTTSPHWRWRSPVLPASDAAPGRRRPRARRRRSRWSAGHRARRFRLC